MLQEESKKYYCTTLRRTGDCSYGDNCRYTHEFTAKDKQLNTNGSPPPQSRTDDMDCTESVMDTDK